MNNINYFSINSSLIVGLSASVALGSFICFSESAEAAISESLSTPIILESSNNQNNQLKNPVIISVSGQSIEPISSISKNTKIALKLEPIVNAQLNQAEVHSPVVLAPVEKMIYQVKPGDTIDKIASKYESSRQDIIQENHINNPNLIEINQNLTIPNEELTQKQSNENVISSDFSTDEINKQIQEQSSEYVEQLKADVSKLRKEYQTSSITVSFENKQKLSSEAVKIAHNYNNSSDLAQNNVLTDSQISPNSIKTEFEQNQTSQKIALQEKVTLKVASNSSGDMVATTPTPISRYNPFLQTSVGETVSPNLPPLSSPEQYLPDTPKFEGYIWPAKGVFTSGYGPRWGRMHRGVDIASAVGTPIMAAAQGEVVSAGWNSGGFGNLVKLQHPDGSLTLYAHNKRLLVRRGQIVEQGQRIAEMGNSGRSTGPHLHFEIHPNGKGAVNPIAFLPKSRP